MKALQACSYVPGRYTTGATPVPGRPVIAVVDTGTDCTHPDFINTGGSSTNTTQGGQLSFALSSAIVPTAIVSPACLWQDDFGHGTHVAGTIAAATSNGVGVP